MNERSVYFFGGGSADGGRLLRDLLGGKGAHLAEMAKLGLAVPPGFTVTTEVCAEYSLSGTIPQTVRHQIGAALGRLEQIAGKRVGGPGEPLLLSVRSGARVSMPGMMDTVLDLGLNDDTVKRLAETDRRFAYDCYRRFCAMFGGVVLGLGDEPFEDLLDQRKRSRAATSDAELDAEDLAWLAAASKALIVSRTGEPLPADPLEQLYRSKIRGDGFISVCA